jgi:hypothetical protein
LAQKKKIEKTHKYPYSLFDKYVCTMKFFEEKVSSSLADRLLNSKEKSKKLTESLEKEAKKGNTNKEILKELQEIENKIIHDICVSFYNLTHVQQRNLNFILNHFNV